MRNASTQNPNMSASSFCWSRKDEDSNDHVNTGCVVIWRLRANGSRPRMKSPTERKLAFILNSLRFMTQKSAATQKLPCPPPPFIINISSSCALGSSVIEVWQWRPLSLHSSVSRWYHVRIPTPPYLIHLGTNVNTCCCTSPKCVLGFLGNATNKPDRPGKTLITAYICLWGSRCLCW